MAQKILIVDDDEDILTILGDNLREEGYDVLTAEDGKSGIKLAEENKPDIIILDIMLPDMEGFEVCKIIKDNNDINCKIVMATARLML